jgi:precorrin-6A synthase
MTGAFEQMQKILVIGIGAGNPDYLTVQAIDALNRVDVFFIPDKGAEKAALRELREQILGRFVKDADFRTVGVDIPRRRAAGDDYRGSVDEWHAALTAGYAKLFAEHLGEGEIGGFLVWGDPMLYDSTLRIMERLDVEVEVIPGITSIQALAARHRIAINRIGEPVLVTTGRKAMEGLPEGMDSVVMLDGDQAFARVPDDYDIFWGAYLGTKEEILVSGKLSDVKDEIEKTRADARAKHGWIMDTYLLRRRT